MKKKIMAISLIVVIIIGVASTIIITNKKGKVEDSIKVASDSKMTLEKFSSVSDLMNKSDAIVEVVVTKNKSERDYKGVALIISEVKVTTSIKGEKSGNTIKIMQDKSSKQILKEGETLFMFLSKGIDNPDCYNVVGSTMQGVYTIDLKKETIKPYDSNNTDEALIKSVVDYYSTLR